jgi:hypothetical protein
MQEGSALTELWQRHLVLWEAFHDNGWTTLVMEQSDGTFVAWAGPDESVGVDYVEDCPEHAQAAAMFALKRKSGHDQCSIRCSAFEMRTHTMLESPRGRSPRHPPTSSEVATEQSLLSLSFARATLPASFLGLNCKDFS